MKGKALLAAMGVITLLLTYSCQERFNHSPRIISVQALQEVLPSQSAQIECVASDPDNDELSYTWSASRGKIEGSGSMVTWTAPDSEGIYSISVTVSDGQGGEAKDYITIVVKANSPPVITSLTPSADWVTPSGILQVKCEAEDPDGDALSYEWLANAGSISGTDSHASWIAPQTTGLYEIMVTVTDTYGASDTSSVTISVVPSSPPTIEDLVVTADHKYLKKGATGYLIGKEKDCQIEILASSWSSELTYTWSATGGQILGTASRITWIAPNVSGKFTVSVTVADITGNMVAKSIIFTVVPCSPCTFG